MKYFITLATLSMLVMIAPLSIDTYLPSFHAIAEDLQVSQYILQISVAIFTFFAALSMLVSGVLSDIVGRKTLIVPALVGYSIFSIAIFLVTSGSNFLILRACQGFCSGVITSLVRGMVPELFNGIRAQKALALMAILFGLAPVIAPILGGFLHVYYGWHSIFLFMCLYASIILIIFSCIVPESLAKDLRRKLNWQSIFQPYLAALTNKRFLVLNFCIILMMSPIGIFIGNVSSLALVKLKLTETQFYLLFVPFIAGGMLGSFLSSRFVTIWQDSTFIKVGLTILFLNLLLNLGYFSFYQLSLPFAAVPWFITCMAVSLCLPRFAFIILNFLGKQSVGLASSLQSFFMTISFTLTVGIISPLINNNIVLIYLVPIILAILGISLWSFFNQTLTNRSQN